MFSENFTSGKRTTTAWFAQKPFSVARQRPNGLKATFRKAESLLKNEPITDCRTQTAPLLRRTQGQMQPSTQITTLWFQQV